MPDIWMDVDTAIQVPVSLMPLVDQGDGYTIEDAIAYDEAGIAIAWNFVTTAGVMTTTAITPTTGSNHDWLEEGSNQGMYSIEIPASGGDVDNDTEGFGWITGETDSTLPFRGPTIGFRAAALNNALIDGGDTLDVNVTAMAANVVTAAAIAAAAIDNATFAADVGSTAYATNIIALAVRKALDDYDPATKTEQDTAFTEIKGATFASTDTLEAIRNKLTDIETDTDIIDDGTSGLVKIASDVAAILVDTGSTLPTAAEIKTAVFAGVIDDTITLQQALAIVLSYTAGEVTGGGTTTISFRDVGDSKDRLVLTVDSSGNRSTTVLDGS